MSIRRRDLLALGGGFAAGVLATPFPWRLLDDTAKLTQNGPWIPQVPRGPIEVKTSFCTLCSRGCGMRVRMAAGCPVGIAGMPEHPVTRGALCPLAFGAHQLNWHPRRVRQVMHRGQSAAWDAAVAAFRKASGEGPVLIVDGWRGRAASVIYEEFAKRQGGQYRAVLGAEERSLDPIGEWSGVPATALGYDLENAGTVVSFGAPLLDGWSTPGRVERLWAAGAGEWRLIQVEPTLSRTTSGAWKWVRLLDGGEDALACGLARVLIEERLVKAEGPMPAMTMAESAVRTGLNEMSIRDLARTIVQRGPVLAIAADRSPAVAALNVVLGAVGAQGGIVRRSAPALGRPGDLPHSGGYRAVLVDSSVPWDFRTPDSVEIFRFAAWDGGGNRADWIVPAAGLFEETTDIPAAPGSAIETYAIAEKLVAPPCEVHSALELLAAVDANTPTVDMAIKARAGELRTGEVRTGPPPRAGGIECRLKEWPSMSEPLTAQDWTAGWVAPVLPPLATKLYRDSGLRPAPNGRLI